TSVSKSVIDIIGLFKEQAGGGFKAIACIARDGESPSQLTGLTESDLPLRRKVLGGASTGIAVTGYAGRSARRRPAGLAAELLFQLGNPRRKALIFLARLRRHLLDRLEFFSRHHVEVAQDALGLGLKDGFDLAPDAARHPGGVVHQPGHFVEESVRRLYHWGAPGVGKEWGSGGHHARALDLPLSRTASRQNAASPCAALPRL